MEIYLVGHEGGNALGEHAYTLTVTDIATGWTENRSVPNKARTWVITAVEDTGGIMPFPIIGVDSDNGAEFVKYNLLHWLRATQDHLHPVPRGQLQRRRPRRAEELGGGTQRGRLPPLRHPGRTGSAQQDWLLQSQMTNYFPPQQKPVSKVRDGVKVTKTYDVATTPHRRAGRHSQVRLRTRRSWTTSWTY